MGLQPEPEGIPAGILVRGALFQSIMADGWGQVWRLPPEEFQRRVQCYGTSSEGIGLGSAPPEVRTSGPSRGRPRGFKFSSFPPICPGSSACRPDGSRLPIGGGSPECCALLTANV